MTDAIRREIARPELETRRLVLRMPSPADTDEMTAFVCGNRDHFAPWDPQRDETYFSEKFWRKRLASGVCDLRDATSLQFIFFSKEAPSGPIIGQCTFSGIVRGPFQAAYLGYGLDRHAVGKGLMEEGLRAAIDFCFNELNLHRIMANFMPSNTRSSRLLQKLGFLPEGYARDYLHLAGAWRDHILTALVNDNWKPPEMV